MTGRTRGLMVGMGLDLGGRALPPGGLGQYRAFFLSAFAGNCRSHIQGATPRGFAVESKEQSHGPANVIDRSYHTDYGALTLGRQSALAPQAGNVIRLCCRNIT